MKNDTKYVEEINSLPFDPNYYEIPREIWDAKKCAKMAQSFARDGMGTKQETRGYIGSSQYPDRWGKTRYNGGCSNEGRWYQGEIRRFPIIPNNFEIYYVSTWGFYIREKNTN